ncbi:MAG: hypothetical protein ACI9OJ_003989 [Myxococcota bacterium]|jgi:hypothetical protein
MTEFAANSTVGVMQKATSAFNEESDPWLARNGAVGQLKFAEGVLKATPDNGDLMVLIASNYASFSFGFLVYDLEDLKWGTDEYEVVKNRAADFFKRGRRHAIMRLNQDIEDFGTAVNSPGDRFDQILGELDPEEHVPAMYWLAYSWGNIINLQSDEPDSLADLPRVKRIMKWVRNHHATFENSGPTIFFGVMNTALPKQLGGKPAEAKEAFDAALKATDRKFLMVQALYARHYMRVVNDRAGYERLLNEVLDARDDIYPEQRLANELAKQRARRWLDEVGDHFD